MQDRIQHVECLVIYATGTVVCRYAQVIDDAKRNSLLSAFDILAKQSGNQLST